MTDVMMTAVGIAADRPALLVMHPRQWVTSGIAAVVMNITSLAALVEIMISVRAARSVLLSMRLLCVVTTTRMTSTGVELDLHRRTQCRQLQHR